MQPRERRAVAVLCMASFLAVVDTTIVTIALPAIRRALTLSPVGAQWVMNAYALVFGGFLLLFGRLADRIGRRRSFVAGLVVFAVGSALAGLAPSPWLLIAGRIVQGLGAAAFVPNSLSLLTAAFTDDKIRSRALAAYGAMAGVGFVTGMVGGGLLTQWVGWRSIFLINLPLVAVTLLPVRRVLVESRVRSPYGPLDAGGAIMVTGGLILLIFALTTAPQAGWRSPATLAAAAAGAAALVLLGAWERRHAAPLIPPSVVGRARVLAPNLAIALQSMVGVSWLFLLTLFFQDVRGLDALTSGLMFAPMTAASVAGAVSAGWVVARLGASRAAAIGIALVVGGLVAMAAATAGRPASMIAGTVVGEAGFMLAGVALTIAATNAFRTSDAGLAAGILNTATQLGGGIGLGVIAAVVSAASSQAQITAGAVRLGLLGCITFSFVALVLVLGGMRRAEHPSRDRTPEPRRQTVPDVDG